MQRTHPLVLLSGSKTRWHSLIRFREIRQNRVGLPSHQDGGETLGSKSWPCYHLIYIPFLFPDVERVVALSLSLPLHLSISLSLFSSIQTEKILLSMSLSFYLSIYVSICLSLFISLYIYLCIYLSLSIYLSIYVSLYLSTYLSFSLFFYVNRKDSFGKFLHIECRFLSRSDFRNL